MRRGAQITVAVIIVVLQTISILVLIDMTHSWAEEADLLRERAALLEDQVSSLRALSEKSEQLCAIRTSLGLAYRDALGTLVDRLGLKDRPSGAAQPNWYCPPSKAWAAGDHNWTEVFKCP